VFNKTSTEPVCPFCGTKMIHIWFKCRDNSGWVFAWACSCDVVQFLERMRDELDVIRNEQQERIT